MYYFGAVIQAPSADFPDAWASVEAYNDILQPPRSIRSQESSPPAQYRCTIKLRLPVQYQVVWYRPCARRIKDITHGIARTFDESLRYGQIYL